jgi:hypothetical protein
MIFYNLLWFSKYSVELNKKEKDKTVFKSTYDQVRDIIWTVWKVKGYYACTYEV